MTVKKTSWHYRLWRFGRENSYSEPRDLCRYFWHLALIKILFPSIIAAGFLMGVGWVAWIIWHNPLQTLYVILFSIGVFAAIVGLILAVQKLDSRLKQERLQPRKEPGVMRKYLAARKKQLCPLISVVDD